MNEDALASKLESKPIREKMCEYNFNEAYSERIVCDLLSG
jgi:hypothetical protein